MRLTALILGNLKPRYLGQIFISRGFLKYLGSTVHRYFLAEIKSKAYTYSTHSMKIDAFLKCKIVKNNTLRIFQGLL